jgi:succinate dehydrogenase/fumarate reductase cytochrome b subunit
LGALSIAYIPAGGQLKDYIWHLQQYPFLNALVKAGVVFPLSFHYMGGLRHLVSSNGVRRASAASQQL